MLQQWRAQEKAAMAELGFAPLHEDAYSSPLDGAGEWVALIGLPKHPGDRARQERLVGGARHRPTEETVNALREEPVDERTASVASVGDPDLPFAAFPALRRLEVYEVSEVPAAVAETMRTVRDFLLPYVRERATVEWITAYYERAPRRAAQLSYWLERRAVLRLAAGDVAGAAEVLAEFVAITGDTGIAEIDVPDRTFAANLKAKLA